MVILIGVNKNLMKLLSYFFGNEEIGFLFQADERKSHFRLYFYLIRRSFLFVFEKIRRLKRWNQINDITTVSIH